MRLFDRRKSCPVSNTRFSVVNEQVRVTASDKGAGLALLRRLTDCVLVANVIEENGDCLKHL